MRSTISKLVLLSSLALGATAFAGCSSNKTAGTTNTDGNVGDIGLQLQVGSRTINTVAYHILNAANVDVVPPSSFSVGDAGKLLAVVGNIPAGGPYHLTLSATATDGTACGGTSTPFTVVSHATVVVGVNLVCSAPNEAGSVKVVVTENECPDFLGVSAAVPVGNDISLLASNTSTNLPTSYTWAITQGAGTLSSATVANPVYHCSTGPVVDGEVHLDVTLTETGPNAVASCSSVFHLIIDCPLEGSGTATGTTGTTGVGGSAGAGGAGGSTAGAGGSTAGAGGSTAGAGGSAGGVVDAGQEACTLSVDSDCLACEQGQCPDSLTAVDGCSKFTGAALTNCNAVISCVRTSNCHSGPTGVLGCYCGQAGPAACLAPGGANGACKAAFETALGTTDPTSIQNDITNTLTPGGAAGFLMLCDKEACASTCVPYTATSCQ